MNKNIVIGSSLIVVFLSLGVLTGYFIPQNNQAQYDALLSDFQELNGKYNSLLGDHNNLEGNYTELQAKYNILVENNATLTEAYNELLNDYNLLNLLYQGILGDYNSLITTYNELVSENNNLQNDFDNLVIAYDTLEASYNEMENNYNSLIAEHNALIVDYEALEIEINLLTETYNQLLIERNMLAESLVILQNDFDNLQIDYDLLSIAYGQLAVLHSQLEAEYLLLEMEYNILSQQWDTLATWIRSMTLPAQYMVFAEAVRRYYFEDFYIKDTWATGNISGYWAEFTRFCRDVVLHDSQDFLGTPLEGYWFPEVSNTLADCLKYGNQTEYLAWDIFYWTYYDWLPNWGGWDNYFWLGDIWDCVQWCIDEIDYEYDSDIIVGQEEFNLDYVKFPVETAFRTLGDCEDQAILCAAYLESCGFETMLAGFHDADYLGGFYHMVLLVEIENYNEFWDYFPTCSLWTYAGSVWCFIDTTWDTPFGTNPDWLQYYIDKGVLDSTEVTFAICDLNGAISL